MSKALSLGVANDPQENVFIFISTYYFFQYTAYFDASVSKVLKQCFVLHLRFYVVGSTNVQIKMKERKTTNNELEVRKLCSFPPFDFYEINVFVYRKSTLRASYSKTLNRASNVAHGGEVTCGSR